MQVHLSNFVGYQYKILFTDDTVVLLSGHDFNYLTTYLQADLNFKGIE